jgi:WD40 repeat protein
MRPIHELAVTPDGRTLIAVQFGTAIAGFDARTGQELWRCRDINVYSVQSLAVFPDSERFVIGHNDGSLLVCDAATGKVLNDQPGHRGVVWAAGLTDGDRTGVTTAMDGTIRRWDLLSGQEIGRTAIDQLDLFQALGVAPDGRTVLGRGRIGRAWIMGLINATTGKLITRLPLNSNPVSDRYRPFAWLADGSLIVSDGAGKATRFDRDGRELQTFRADGREVNALAVSPDEQTLVLAGASSRPARGAIPLRGWIGVFDLQSGKLKGLSEYPNPFVNAAYAPDGEAVVLTVSVSARSGPAEQLPSDLDLTAAVVLFDPAHGKIYTPFAAPFTSGERQDHGRSTSTLALAPTGYQFAVAERDGSEYVITLYETASGAIRRQLRGHRNLIEQLAFTRDGSKLVSVSRDLTGLVWDVAPPRPLAPVALSEADRRLRWDALTSSNGETVYRAMGELIADPAGTVAFLKANLRSAPAPSDMAVDKLIERLDASTFTEREAAFRELNNLGTPAVPRARERLPRVILEVRQRLEKFLQEHDRGGRLTGVRLRERRAVELLEAIRSAVAEDVLKSFAKSGNTPLTRDAAAAAKRLSAR